MKKILYISILLSITISAIGQTNRSSIKNPDNPNLNPNWKWYENVGQTMYFSDYAHVIRTLNNISLPFFDNGSPLVAPDDKKDMHPEDGWVLFCKDFGTPYEAPSQPFFVLYNRYSGILRYIFYNAREINYSSFKGELSFLDSSQAGAIMTLTDDVKPFLNNFDKYKTECFIGKVNAFQGWGYADFSLFGYDPNLNKNARIRINIIGINDLTLDSSSTEFNLNQVMEDANLSGSKNNGINVVESINQGVKYYKSANSLVNNLKKEVDKHKKSNSKPWWYNGANSLLSVGSNIIPGIGGIAGFVKSAFFGKDEATPKPMNFTGSLKFTGNITGEFPISSTDIILNHQAPLAPAGSEYYRILQDTPIGVFNLVSAPNIYYVDVSEWYNCDGKTCARYVRKMFFNTPTDNNQIKYVFNDASGLEIKSIESAVVFSNREPDPIPWFHPEMLTKCLLEVAYKKDDPIGLALKITFKTKQPTKNISSEKVMYKVYPFGVKREATTDEWTKVGFGKSYYYSSSDMFVTNEIFTKYNKCKYFIAGNSITFSNDFQINNNSLPSESQGVLFIAGKRINLYPNAKILSNKSIKIKVAGPDSFRQRSSSDNEEPRNNLVDILREIEAAEGLDLKNLNVAQEAMIENVEKSTLNINQISCFDTSNIVIYPNPTFGLINLDIPSDMKVTNIEVHNMMGKKVIQRQYNNNPSEVALTGNPSGMYFLRIYYEGGMSDHKIMLK